ncbi:MAG: hypothetical protein ACRD0U_06945, partial [Acidimicrobiales bacterium]
GVIFALLLVPGLIGFDAWPLTAWRLFSLAREETQTRWEMEAVAADGSSRPVDPDELPIAFRLAEWPLASLTRASTARRDEVCLALLGGVVEVVPGTSGLRIVRDRQRMVHEAGDWVVLHDREPFHECTEAGE